MAAPAPRTWNVEYVPAAQQELAGLPEIARSKLMGALKLLAQEGPGLRRPPIGAIRTSQHHNMREVRSFGGNVRALFAFDHRRTAVILAVGEKTGNWKGWYKDNIRLADQRYGEHLREHGKEPACQTRQSRAAQRAKARTR